MGKMKKQAILILGVVIFSLVFISSAYAEDAQSSLNNNSYVDVSGNNSWDGSSPTHVEGTTTGPKYDISSGVSVTNKGGSLYIASGTYSVSSQITLSQNINIFGEGMNSTIIDGGGRTRIFEINEGVTVNIANLTLRNGKASDGGTGDNGHYGGAIYNKGTLLIDNCNLYNNAAGNGANADNYHDGGNGGNGGAIYNDNSGTLTIQNSLIHDNKAGNGGAAKDDTAGSWGKPGNGGYGGAISNEKTLKVINCEIYNNHAGQGGQGSSEKSQGEGGKGGAIYIKEDATGNITGCYIHDNISGQGNPAGSGGAIYNKGTLTIAQTIISNNKAANGLNGNDADWNKDTDYLDAQDGGDGGSGGGICNSGTLTLTDSTITCNSAGDGGTGGDGCPCYNDDDGNPKVSFLDPGNGGAGGNGGGIYNSGSINSIINTIINNNNAGTGGTAGSEADDAVDIPWYKVDVASAGNGGSGGAIYSSGTLTIIQNSTINYNAAGNGGTGSPVSRSASGNGGNGGNGGGILFYHSIEITACQISNNKAGNGGNGGNRATWDVNPSTEPGNGGKGGSGGGIYFYYEDNDNDRTVNINNSTLYNNTAGTGGPGGIDDYDGSQSSDGGNSGSGGAIAIISKSTNSKPSSNLHVIVEQCTIASNQVGTGGQPYKNGKTGSDGYGGGIYTDDYHYFTVAFNRIVNNAPQAVYLNIKNQGNYSNMQFVNNWWGSNNEPKDNITTCSGTTMYTTYYAPWLILSINSATDTVYPNQVSSVNTNLTMNSNNENTLSKYGMYVPNGTPVLFNANMGTMNPQDNVTIEGGSNSNFIPNSAFGDTIIYATVDSQTVNTIIHVYTAGVDLTKTVNNTLPNVGDTIKFTVTAKNNGSDNATGLVITDLIPQGLSNLTYTASTGQNTYSLTSGIWDIGTLLNGVTATLEVTGTVTSALAGLNTTNYANITSLNEVNPNPLTANASFYVPYVNITVLQHPWYFDGESQTYQTVSSCYNTIVYDVDVLNTGVDAATGVVVKEVLGEGYQLVGLSTDGVGTTSYDSITRTITWNIASLPAGIKAVLSLNALVIGTGNNTPNLVVNASMDQVDQYNVGRHNWSDWSVYVAPSADIQINQTQEVTNETDGQYITYTITATNNGPDEANAIQVTDNLPEGLVDPLVLPSTGTYTLNSNKIIWTMNSLAKGSSAILIAKAKINNTGTIVNTATKTSQGEFDWEANNNAQTCILTLSGNYTPEVNMEVKQYPWYYNDRTDTYQTESGYYKTIVYSVVVKNTGVNDATGVVVKEVLGDGYQFLNCTTKGDGTASFDNATNTITWNIGYMPAGGKVCLSVFALVIATGNNTPELMVNASLAHVDQYDIPGLPKWSSYSIYVPSTLDPSLADNKGDLFLNLISGDSNVQTGDLITLKYKLGNYGPSNATDVKVKIHIPEGLEFVDANVDVGTWYYDNATRTLVWILPQVKVGDPYLDLHLRGLENGDYVLKPIITSPTYLLSAGDIISPVNINVAAGGDIINGNSSTNGNTSSVESVEAASNAIGMQETGIPLPSMVLALLMVMGGFLVSRRK
jgi:uncharacterized repeat protein (TIGR01451 family)